MDLVGTSFAQPALSNAENLCDKHKGSANITFGNKATVLRGKCIRHLKNCVLYVGIQIETGELCIIKEFVAQKDNVQNIIKDLEILLKIDHTNLALMKCYKYDCKDDEYYFYILYDFDFDSIFMSQLSNIGDYQFSFDLQTLIARESLELLNYLKNNNMLYLDFASAATYLDPHGTLKYINYGLKKEKIVQSHGTSKNSGLELVPLYRSLSITEELGEINSLYEDDLNSIKSFFTRFLEQQSIITEINEELQPQLDLVTNEQLQQRNEQPKSSFKNHFNIEGLIGKGGFGEVYKVEGKLDNRLYAIKVIKLSKKNERAHKKLLDEVKLLSQLKHENIVCYMHSWTEEERLNDVDEKNDDGVNDTDSEDICESLENNLSYNSKKSYLKHLTSSENVDESIEFQCDEDEGDKEDNNKNLSSYDNMTKKILYIQMEYCDKNTLDRVIDSGELCKENVWNIERIWSFLREIVEGLVHIHQMGITHRDLKPENIFLDGKDHIKIGDFGLATKKTHYRAIYDKREFYGSNSASTSSTDIAGTHLYQAPELFELLPCCDQKLDMYSLGIILFEMCYKRPETKMEKIKILEDLRKAEILFPKDFDHNTFSNQGSIIRSLLNHNKSERPSSKDLQASPKIPQNVETKKMETYFQHIIKDDHYSANMLTKLIERQQTLYSIDKLNTSFKNITNLDIILQKVVNIFRTHGGEHISTPTIVLNNDCMENCENCIKMINKMQTVYTLPCNSRIPFAKYAAKNQNLKLLKRYSLDKRMNENLDEVHVCNFDIIGTLTSAERRYFLPDAEILVILHQIKNCLINNIYDRKFVIKISHTSLLVAIFIECCILENANLEEYAKLLKGVPVKIKTIFRNKWEKLTKSFKGNFQLPQILHNFEDEDARLSAQRGLTHLQYIIQTADKLGVKNCLVVHPGLMTDFSQYSGMFFECVYEMKHTQHVLCTGGRYDGIMKNCQLSLPRDSVKEPYFKKGGVGLSICLEKWNSIIRMQKDIIFIFSLIPKSFTKSEGEVLRRFWDAGIACNFFKMSSFESINNFCRNGTMYAIILNKKDSKIITYKNGSVQAEMIVNPRSLVDEIKTMKEKII